MREERDKVDEEKEKGGKRSEADGVDDGGGG